MIIFNAMHDQGINILTEDTFVTLQEASEPHSEFPKPPVSAPVFGLLNIKMPPVQYRIHLLMMSASMPSLSDNSRMRLMDQYSRRQHWAEFWEIWRWPFQRGLSQSADMYAFMFDKIAATNHQSACTHVLRDWVSTTQRENPVVKLEGDVAEAIKACLRVADPHVEQDASDPNFNGEWVTIWRKCEPDL